MVEWIQLEESISLENLLTRWASKKINEITLDFPFVKELVMASKLTAYEKKGFNIINGRREFYGEIYTSFNFALIDLSTFAPRKDKDIIFDLAEIRNIEKSLSSGSSASDLISTYDHQKEIFLRNQEKTKPPESAPQKRAKKKDTSAATRARQDKRIEEWKEIFKAMIPVILYCVNEGPKKRTKGELEAICTKLGIKLTTPQMDLLRECLGKDHINTGGAPKQG